MWRGFGAKQEKDQGPGCKIADPDLDLAFCHREASQPEGLTSGPRATLAPQGCVCEVRWPPGPVTGGASLATWQTKKWGFIPRGEGSNPRRAQRTNGTEPLGCIAVAVSIRASVRFS